MVTVDDVEGTIAERPKQPLEAEVAVTSPEERDPYAAPSEDAPTAPPPSDRPSDRPSERPDDPPRLPPGYGSAPPPLVPYGQPAGDEPRPGGPPSAAGPIEPGGRRAFLLAVAGAVMSVVFFPIGIVLDIAAIVLAFRARKRAAKAGGTAPLSAPAVFIGGIGLAFASGLLAFIALFFDEFRAYQSCMGGANTEVARQECNDEFRIDIENRLG
jgi:hypothetical protein